MPGFLEPILWILFVAACALISIVILLQEGKGGGLGEAFGGAGQQAFGVKAQGIQKFTGWVALSVIVLSVLITLVRGSSELDLPDALPAPATPGAQAPMDGGAQAPMDGGAQAPMDGGAPAPAGEPAPATPPAGEGQ